MTASTTRCRPALLLALLAALLVAVPQAAVGLDRPTASFAFHGPAGQIVQEFATETLSGADPLIEASSELASVVGTSRRPGSCEPSSSGLSTDLGALTARAPPSV